MFACRFNEFERKDRKAHTKGMGGGRVRARATKKVSESYQIARAKREKEVELVRLKKEAREAQNETLNKRMQEIEAES